MEINRLNQSKRYQTYIKSTPWVTRNTSHQMKILATKKRKYNKNQISLLLKRKEKLIQKEMEIDQANFEKIIRKKEMSDLEKYLKTLHKTRSIPEEIYLKTDDKHQPKHVRTTDDYKKTELFNQFCNVFNADGKYHTTVRTERHI